MNAKIYMLLAVAFMVLLPTVQAVPISGSLTSPANIVVNYQINTVTDFLVNITGTESQLNFSSNRDGKLVEPTGQIAASSTPWATIENRGEVAQSFKLKIAAVNTGTTIYVSNVNTFSPQTTVSTTLQTPAGWANAAACPDSDPGPNYLCAPSPGGGGIVNAYLRANFTNAPAGTGTLTIST